MKAAAHLLDAVYEQNPDYMQDDMLETYFTHVWADDVPNAINFARLECYNQHKDAMNSPNDFAVLLVLSGHHDDLYDPAYDRGVGE